MPEPDDPLPRMTVAEMAAELRDEVTELEADLPGIPPHETVGGQAAQTLEELEATLTEIAAGAPDPRARAAAALRLDKPLRPFGGATDTIRALLKPRRT